MRSQRVLLAGTALAVLGCGTARMQARARQPNPLAGTGGVLRESARLHIDLRDVELPHYVLRNTAFFHVVSRDRLRFHVALTHKWREMTDVSQWQVHLEDDRGRRWHPEGKEVRSVRHLTRMTDVDRRSTLRVNPADDNSDIIHVNNDGYLRRVPLASVDVFRGEGDLVFHGRDIFTREVRRLVLVMRRAGTELRYEWEFGDGPIQVEHYGQRAPDRRPSIPADGRTVLPGPLTGGQ